MRNGQLIQNAKSADCGENSTECGHHKTGHHLHAIAQELSANTCHFQLPAAYGWQVKMECLWKLADYPGEALSKSLLKPTELYKNLEWVHQTYLC